ncbi:ABC transporter transmembrane region [Peptostreptococcaceae bacterium AS15]|nr:ABC transporter transmembrane region [Peptostreptococcaceae bacterium AS15]
MNKTILSCVREFKKQSFLAPFFITLEVIMEILIPYVMANIIDIGIKNSDMEYVVKTGLVLLVMAMMSLFFGATGARFAATAATGLSKNLRSDIFKKIQKFSFKNIDKFSSASLVTRLTTDIANVQMAYMMMIIMVARSPIMMISALIMAFKINAQISMIFLVAIPALIVIMYTIIKIAAPKFTVVYDQYDVMNNMTAENVRAQRVVKAYVREEFENSKFSKLSAKIYELFVDVELNVAVFNPSIQLVLYIMVTALFLMGGKLIVSGSLTTGQFTSLMIYSIQILMSVIAISFVFVLLIIAETGIMRITEVLEEEPAMDENAKGEKEVKDGSIEFKNVSFSYSDDEQRLALKNVNISIKSGETIGVIGSIGSAKSTFVSLIPRLYDVTSGEITVGGKNVKDYELAALRDNVSMVLQKNTLFTGTIADNIRWGNENATDEEVEFVCKLACADEFIQKFPKKYEEQIYEGGNNVSGGQKQRLTIARALLKKPKILILDDSTSAVDTKTDAKIREAFATQLKDTTKIIIAQRISSIENSDRIIVLDNGEVVGFDTPQNLLMNNQIYRENYEFQKQGGGLGDE